VTWDEIPGREHWWWDSDVESDGGCVNDLTMRAFFARALRNSSFEAQPASKSPSKGKSSKAAAKAAASEAELAAGGDASYRAAVPFPTEDFELLVVNPASQV